MKFSKSSLLFVSGGLLVIVFLLIILTSSRFGKAYQKNIRTVSDEPEPKSLTIFRRDTIKKVTIRKSGDQGCMELTPDGAVRVYTVCGKRLKQAVRLSDSKYITKLFKLVTEEDLSFYQQKKDDSIYEVTLETDTGIKTLYLVLDVGSDSVAQVIIQTIISISQDMPKPSPESGQTPFPTESENIQQGTLTPTAILDIGFPTPGPTGTVNAQSFTCGFTEGGNIKKPFNISNIICSTEPSPAP